MITKEQIKSNPTLVDATIDFVLGLYGYATEASLAGYIANVITEFSLLFWNSTLEKDMVEESQSALQILHSCAQDLDAAFVDNLK